MINDVIGVKATDARQPKIPISSEKSHYAKDVKDAKDVKQQHTP